MSIPKLRIQLDVEKSIGWGNPQVLSRYDADRFADRVFSEARNQLVNTGAGQQSIDGLDAMANSPVFYALVSSCGQSVARMMTTLAIVPDDEATLESADIEVLERAYIAIGAEMDRRKAIGSGE